MPVLYFKDSLASGSQFGSLQVDGAAGTAATTTTGWNHGTVAINNYCALDYGVEVARNATGATGWSTTVRPNATLNNTTGDALRTENPLSGTFTGGTWTFSFATRAVGNATGTGRIRVRLFRGANADGSGVTEITLSSSDLSILASRSTTANSVSSATLTVNGGSALTLNNEYLFVALAFQITTAGTNTNADVDFRSWESTITTPAFTLAAPNAPTATAATDVQASQFQANWTAPTGGTAPTGYQIDVATNSGFTAFLSGYQNKVLGNTTSVIVLGASASTQYWYRVRATAANGSSVSGNSNTITLTTAAPPPVSVPYINEQFLTDTAVGGVALNRTAEPGPGSYTISGNSSVLAAREIKNRFFRVSNPPPVVWNDVHFDLGVYNRADIGAIVYAFRPGVNTGQFAVVLSSTLKPANPTAEAMHWRVDNVNAPHRLHMPYGMVGRNDKLRSIDYRVVFVPRTGGGAWVLLSGGIYGAWPNASLIGLLSADALTTTYVGIATGEGWHWADGFRLLDSTQVPAAWRQRFGLAAAADTFQRANSTTLGSTDIGAKAWVENAGDWQITGNALTHVSGGDSHKVTMFNSGIADGLFEFTITPTATHVAECVFRGTDANNYLSIQLYNSGLALMRRVAGAETSVTSTGVTVTAGQPHRVLVEARGSSLRIWFNNNAVFGQTVFTETAQQTATGVGARTWGPLDNGSTWNLFHATPLVHTLPSDLFPPRVPPAPVGNTLWTDSFTNTDGTRLSTHNPLWEEY